MENAANLPLENEKGPLSASPLLAKIEKYRNPAIDILRGAIMIIMALDHVRDFVHMDAKIHDPLDLDTTTPLLFFTRWITHFCAPLFVFLAGVSANLYGQKRTKKELSGFLFTRGLWLLILEIVVISRGWDFIPDCIIFQVIFAIGMSMIVLSALVNLRPGVILALAILILAGHNLYDFVNVTGEGKMGFIPDMILYKHPQIYRLNLGLPFHIALFYSFLTFTGIMSLGYYFGRFFSESYGADRRKKTLLTAGISMLGLFILLRFINVYGDPAPWSFQKDPMLSFLSFLKVSKYPPSLLYCLMTLGTGLVILPFLEQSKGWLANFLKVFGSVPFFYYMLHLYLVHILSSLLYLANGQAITNMGEPNTGSIGFSLGTAYLIWAVVIAILYPLCKWYQRYKSSHSQWWLKYI